MLSTKLVDENYKNDIPRKPILALKWQKESNHTSNLTGILFTAQSPVIITVKEMTLGSKRTNH